jgi:hypothetical protein
LIHIVGDVARIEPEKAYSFDSVSSQSGPFRQRFSRSVCELRRPRHERNTPLKFKLMIGSGCAGELQKKTSAENEKNKRHCRCFVLC